MNTPLKKQVPVKHNISVVHHMFDRYPQTLGELQERLTQLVDTYGDTAELKEYGHCFDCDVQDVCVVTYRDETDVEYNKRLTRDMKRKELAELKRQQKIKDAAAKARLEQAAELALYKQLKAKYEK